MLQRLKFYSGFTQNLPFSCWARKPHTHGTSRAGFATAGTSARTGAEKLAHRRVSKAAAAAIRRRRLQRLRQPRRWPPHKDVFYHHWSYGVPEEGADPEELPPYAAAAEGYSRPQTIARLESLQRREERRLRQPRLRALVGTEADFSFMDLAPRLLQQLGHQGPQEPPEEQFSWMRPPQPPRRRQRVVRQQLSSRPLPQLAQLWPLDAAGRLRPLKKASWNGGSSWVIKRTWELSHRLETLRNLEEGGVRLLLLLAHRLERDIHWCLASLPPREIWLTDPVVQATLRRRLRRLRCLQEQLLLETLLPTLDQLREGLTHYPWWKTRANRLERQLEQRQRRLELLQLRLEVAPQRLSWPLLWRQSDLKFLLPALWRRQRQLQRLERQLEQLQWPRRLRLLRPLPPNSVKPFASAERQQQYAAANKQHQQLRQRAKWLLPVSYLWSRRLLGLMAGLGFQPWWNPQEAVEWSSSSLQDLQRALSLALEELRQRQQQLERLESQINSRMDAMHFLQEYNENPDFMEDPSQRLLPEETSADEGDEEEKPDSPLEGSALLLLLPLPLLLPLLRLLLKGLAWLLLSFGWPSPFFWRRFSNPFGQGFAPEGFSPGHRSSSAGLPTAPEELFRWARKLLQLWKPLFSGMPPPSSGGLGAGYWSWWARAAAAVAGSPPPNPEAAPKLFGVHQSRWVNPEELEPTPLLEFSLLQGGAAQLEELGSALPPPPPPPPPPPLPPLRLPGGGLGGGSLTPGSSFGSLFWRLLEESLAVYGPCFYRAGPLLLLLVAGYCWLPQLLPVAEASGAGSGSGGGRSARQLLKKSGAAAVVSSVCPLYCVSLGAGLGTFSGVNPLPLGSLAFGKGSSQLLLLSSGGLLQGGAVVRWGANPVLEQQLAQQQGLRQLPSCRSPLPLQGEGPQGSGFVLTVTQDKLLKRGRADSLVITYDFGAAGAPPLTSPQKAFLAGCFQGDGSIQLRSSLPPGRSPSSGAALVQTGSGRDMASLLFQATLLPDCRIYPLEGAGEGYRLKILTQEGLQVAAQVLAEGGFFHQTKSEKLMELRAALGLGPAEPSPAELQPAGAEAVAKALGLLLTDGTVTLKGETYMQLEVTSKYIQDLEFLPQALCPQSSDGGSTIYDHLSNKNPSGPKIGRYDWKTLKLGYPEAVERLMVFVDEGGDLYGLLPQHPKIQKMQAGVVLVQLAKLKWHREPAGTEEAVHWANLQQHMAGFAQPVSPAKAAKTAAAAAAEVGAEAAADPSRLLLQNAEAIAHGFSPKPFPQLPQQPSGPPVQAHGLSRQPAQFSPAVAGDGAAPAKAELVISAKGKKIIFPPGKLGWRGGVFKTVHFRRGRSSGLPGWR